MDLLEINNIECRYQGTPVVRDLSLHVEGLPRVPGEMLIDFVGPAQTFERLGRQFSALDVLDGRAEPLCTLAEGVQTLKVNLAALASADDGGAWKTV